jgi:acetate kinase
MSLILVLNAGSSSVKFALIDTSQIYNERDLARGAIDGIGQSPRWSVKDADGKVLDASDLPNDPPLTHRMAIQIILEWIDARYGLASLAAAGHRVVHGGPNFVAPVRLDKAKADALRMLVPLAPLHQPHNLAAIDALFELKPDLPQMACFDTAFHASMPDIARNFALPRELTAKGIRRYGFHGISYDYIAHELARRFPDIAKGRVIVAHLGNGSSLCAMQNGKSIATTMGFSALDGLMMGTRTGTIDPAVIFYLMRNEMMSAEEVEKLLYNKSGLLGVSGLSNDMRTLRKAASVNAHAREALDMFAYRVSREIGSLASALGGLDGLVFTAGIGENDSELRADVVNALSYLGLSLDRSANADRAEKISTRDGPIALVLPTNEEMMIARQTAALL